MSGQFRRDSQSPSWRHGRRLCGCGGTSWIEYDTGIRCLCGRSWDDATEIKVEVPVFEDALLAQAGAVW